MKIIASAQIIILTTLTSACSLFGIRGEETPDYEVVVKDDNKEIRNYKEHIVAKTTVQGEYKDAQSKAFKILAGYIFGGNTKKESIAMTAPVVQSPEKSETITMTAPVLQSPSDGGWTMTFMMPSKYKMSDLPKPNDDRILFEQVPSKLTAAIGFSWLLSETNIAEKADELTKWLESQNSYKPISNPVSAGYDPPWTLPFLRRNEVLVDVSKIKED